MPMTQAQLATLKADIAANANTVPVNGTPTPISAVPASPDNAAAVAAWYNLEADPAYWVWRTRVTKSELVTSVGPDGTTFNWTGNGFIARSAGEQTAWQELFNGSQSVNAALTNVRQAFADIFSGTGNAAANRTHLLAVARRKAAAAEKLFATGTGSTASPAAMAFEGSLTAADVLAAWAS